MLVVLVALALGVEVAWATSHILQAIDRLEATTVDQVNELKAAVGQLGTDLDELANRLTQPNPDIDGVVAALRSMSSRVDSMATGPTPDPGPEPDPGT